MNAVWKDLDPIFKGTLRKYATENNRLLFDVYAKAVGFNPSHVGLLYLTLKLEEDQFETNDGKKRSYGEMYQSDNEHPNDSHQCNEYLQISVYNNQNNSNNAGTTHHQESHDIIAATDTEPHTLTLPSLDITTHRPSKRRKTSLEPTGHHYERPSIHSVVCKVFQEAKSSTNITKSSNAKSRGFVQKIPSPLPAYNIHNNPSYTEDLHSSKHTQELNEYEKLKALGKQFKDKKVPTSVVQNNKRKIGELLRNCDDYRASLVKKYSTTTRTLRSRTTTTTTVSTYTHK